MSDDIFSDAYIPPPPTDEELAQKRRNRAIRRLIRAADHNVLLCEQCDARFLDVHQAMVQRIWDAPDERVIPAPEKCQQPFACKALIAFKAIQAEPPPRVSKITPTKLAAFRKRKGNAS